MGSFTRRLAFSFAGLPPAFVGGLVICLAYAALKIPALRPAISDENIYFYMAWRMSDGVLPYRDFFYANPPGLLLPGAVITLLIGPEFIPLKALPMLAALGALVLTYILIVRRAGTMTAFLCVTTWMLGGTFIRASSHWTGINVTMFLLVLAIFLMARGRGGWSGVVLALAGLTKTYGLVAFPALWLGAFLQGKDTHRRFLLGFFPLTVGVNVFLLAFAGEEFIRQTIRYHMAKPPNPQANLDAIRTLVSQSRPWIVVCFFALLLSVVSFPSHFEAWKQKTRGKDRKSVGRPDPLPWICFAFILSFALFMMAQKRVFSFYLLPLFPVLCIFLGDGIRWLEKVLDRVRNGVRGPLRRLPVAVFLAIPIAASHRDVGKYMIDELVYGFPEAFAIAEYVEEKTDRDETIFGYSGAAPLVAFLAERRLADDQADTNAMRFRSGMDDVQKVFREAEKDNLRYILALWRKNRYHVGMFRVKEFIEEVESRYRIERRWPSNKGTYILYVAKSPRSERIPPSPRPSPPETGGEGAHRRVAPRFALRTGLLAMTG